MGRRKIEIQPITVSQPRSGSNSLFFLFFSLQVEFFLKTLFHISMDIWMGAKSGYVFSMSGIALLLS
jgi:hypothetical protein